MYKLFQNLKLNTKVALLGVGSVLITALALVVIAVWQSGEYNILAQSEIDQLINADLDHIAQGVYNLVKTQDEAIQKQVSNNIEIAQYIVQRKGEITLSKELVTWNAENQFSNEKTSVHLPKLLIGGQWLGMNYSFQINSYVVDEISKLINETVTFFQRMNDNNDMLRVATTVKTSANKRAIGIYIPFRNEKGEINPVISTVMKGETYNGRAFVVDSWYLTSYKPLKDKTGKLIGMLYVGVKQSSIESIIKQSIINTKVGKTGYVYVIGGIGEEKGKYIISQNGERDGENIYESTDSEGNFIIKRIIDKAVILKPGEFATDRYPWKNPGDPYPRWKVSRLAYYAPWDWVIGTSVYEDELQNYRRFLHDGRTRMSTIMIIAGLIIILIVSLLGVIVAWTLARPIRIMTDAAETIMNGDLNYTVSIESKDEIGKLANSFNTMTHRLKEVMDGLRVSEEKYRTIFENVLEGVFRSTISGKFVSANMALANMLKYNSPEELISEVYDIRNQLYVNPEERDIVISILLENGKIQGREIQILRKDGVPIWILMSAKIVKNETGDPIYLDGFITDITRRKKAEIELFESERKLYNIIQGLPIATFVINKDHEVIQWNKAIETLSQIKADEMIGTKNHWKIFYKSERPCMADLILDSKEEQLPNLYKERFLKSSTSQDAYEVINYNEDFSGGRKWFRITAIPVKDSSGNIIAAIETLEDLTELKRSEEILKRSELQFRELFDHAPVGYHEIDITGMIIRVNKTELDMLGYDEKEMIHHFVWDFIVEKELSRNFILQKLNGQSAVETSFERTFIRKDGSTLPVLIEDLLLTDSNGMIIGIRSTIQNITEHKQAESERLRLQNLEALGVLAGGIAHDFNNILTSITGKASVTLLKVKDEETEKNIKSMLEATKRAVSLTKQLLTFAKGETPEKRSIDIKRTVQETAAFALSGSNIILELDYRHSLNVEADQGQISQVIQNLVINAKQAMPTGGTIVISTEDFIDHLGEKFVNIKIKDSGTGIPAKYLNRIFDPYFTTKQSGSGLGLAVTHSIIIKHGGSISVDSKPGIGTVFSILLPSSDQIIEEEHIIETGSIDTLKILIMDDDDSVREVFKEILLSLKHNVTECLEGKRAVELYKESLNSGKKYDIVFLDLTIKGGQGGIETAKILRGIDPDVKLVVSSGYSEGDSSAYEKEFDAKLDKPYTIDEVKRIIFELMN